MAPLGIDVPKLTKKVYPDKHHTWLGNRAIIEEAGLLPDSWACHAITYRDQGPGDVTDWSWKLKPNLAPADLGVRMCRTCETSLSRLNELVRSLAIREFSGL